MRPRTFTRKRAKWYAAGVGLATMGALVLSSGGASGHGYTDLPVSRQAVQKHLGTLAAAGLVATRRSGREVLYRPTPAPMSEALAWMAEVGAQWDDRLAALERQLARRRGLSA